jgi:hypothetical protein
MYGLILDKEIPPMPPEGFNHPCLIPLDIPVNSFNAGQLLLDLSYTGLVGYDYLLKSITLVYPKWCDYNEVSNVFENPAGHINIELYYVNIALQSAPVPSRDMTLPAGDGLDFCVKTPTNPANYRRSLLPANYLGSKKLVNQLFEYGTSIRVRLTRAPNHLDSVPSSPAHKFNIFLHGYNCPEKTSGVW